MACGTKGYEEIHKQHLAYPSPRTLQHRTRHLKFKPGILDEVFKLQELKVSIGGGICFLCQWSGLRFN